ncbi:MAG: AmpG family muropeptide MFS transporter [Methylomonas sp.]|nr:MAG: AmpG family muropeptide MFS transporter [Methylobacter sp.]PPD34650.1 MAG: AmpG family muropeptide MFS transporter [Methylomonas sp.]
MAAKTSWLSAFSIYAQPRVLSMVFLGFSAGLPYLLVFSTLSAWLRDEGVTRTVIGFFSWAGVMYSVKVFWAPVIDNFRLPFLGRLLGKRRSWMLLAQLGIMAGLAAMSFADSRTQLQLIAVLAVAVAFCSATQDVAIDAYRIESVVTELQGAMAATYVLGYRIALLIAGAGAFYIAEYSDWHTVYRVMAVTMGVGIIATVCIKEPESAEAAQPAESLDLELDAGFFQRGIAVIKRAAVHPIRDFFSRQQGLGWLILLVVAVYKMSDITMGVMANPFYLDLGFSKKAIAEVSKVFGFFMTIAGAGIGGILVLRLGVLRSLLLGGILTASTNLLFAGLAVSKPGLLSLALVISADNLSGGIAGSVFIAFLSGLTSPAYTATQYAALSSLMTLPALLLGGFSGVVVDHFGYFTFFIYSAGIGVPAIVLATVLLRCQHRLTARSP